MSDHVVQDIKDRLDVVEVVGSYLSLKRAGVNWKANCPFHNEKTPSFNVNPTRQIWHCFGCGLGGDIFSFVQQFERLDFPETLKLLADRAGVTLPERSVGDKQKNEWQEKAYRINAFAAKYYHAVLNSPQGEQAKAYLKKRGLEDETLATWQIGFAPEKAQTLGSVLAKKGVTQDDLVRSGLVVRADGGRTYDRFYGRVTFPILNHQGKVVGFSARLLQDRPNAAKYVNSSESEVYKKSDVLFGLFLAKNAIVEMGEAVVVEGQMDCIKAHQAGLSNTVASSGTALTEQQLRRLKKLTGKLVLALDNDSAGQEACYRAVGLALPLGFEVRVAAYEGAKDPDELISHHPEVWKTAVLESIAAVDFYIQQAGRKYKPGSLDLGRFIVSAVLPLVRLLPSALDQDHYLKTLSRQFGLEMASLKKEMQKPPLIAQAAQTNPTPQVGTEPEKHALGRQTEFFVLAALRHEEAGPVIAAGLEVEDFTDPDTASCAKSLMSGNNLSIAEKLVLQEAEFLLESLSDDLGGNQDKLTAELLRIFDTFRLQSLKRQQEALTLELRQAEQNKDQLVIEKLKAEFLALSRRRLELEIKIQNQ